MEEYDEEQGTFTSHRRIRPTNDAMVGPPDDLVCVPQNRQLTTQQKVCVQYPLSDGWCSRPLDYGLQTNSGQGWASLISRKGPEAKSLGGQLTVRGIAEGPGNHKGHLGGRRRIASEPMRTDHHPDKANAGERRGGTQAVADLDDLRVTCVYVHYFP